VVGCELLLFVIVLDFELCFEEWCAADLLGATGMVDSGTGNGKGIYWRIRV